MTAIVDSPSGPRTAARMKIARYREARDRATRWLLTHLNDDGSMGDASGGWQFYRAPWTFSLVGETQAAAASCDWVRRNLLQPDGALSGPRRVVNDAWAYRDSAFIVGAHMAGQYDLSRGLMPGLLRWQDPISGGFANDRLPDGSMSDDMDIPYTCGGGFASVATGDLEAARRAYSYLARIYMAQEQLPEKFYVFWSRSRQRPITEADPEFELRMVVENQADRHQRWTIGGISAGFLCRLYLAEPRPEYLALARRYQAFSMAATEHQFKYGPVCKSGWGSSLLYGITGEPQYQAWSERLGDWFVAGLNEQGYWPLGRPDAELGVHIHAALEFVMHLDTLISGLSSRTA